MSTGLAKGPYLKLDMFRSAGWPCSKHLWEILKISFMLQWVDIYYWHLLQSSRTLPSYHRRAVESSESREDEREAGLLEEVDEVEVDHQTLKDKKPPTTMVTATKDSMFLKFDFSQYYRWNLVFSNTTLNTMDEIKIIIKVTGSGKSRLLG